MRQIVASMRRSTKLAIVCIGVALFCGESLHAAALDLEIRLLPTVLYEGDSGQLELRVSGGRTDKPPRIAPSEAWEIKATGAQRQDYRREQWINGEHQVDKFKGAVFTYAITPQRAGKLSLGAITITDGRSQQTHPGPVVQVLPPDTDEAVRVSLTSDRQSGYVGQAATLTLTIEIAAIKGSYADNEPVWPNSPPQLSCNLFDKQEIAGIDRSEMSKTLQAMLSSRSRTPAFAINDFTVQSNGFPFTGLPGFRMPSFGEQTPARFRLETERVDKPGGRVWRYTTQLTCIFTATGSYTFGPASLKGEVIRDADEQGRPIMRSVFVRSEPLTIEIESAPQQGRPASYVGVIATNLQVQASLDTQTCNVGDPLTLSLSVDGNFDRTSMTAPALQNQRNLELDFIVYGDTVQARTTEPGKHYDYQLRPRRAGTLEVPPLDISFYDITRDTYITVQTAPIPVRANEAEHLSSAAILAGPSAAIAIAVSDAADEFTPAPLLPIAAGAETIMQPWHALLFALGPCIYLLALSAHLVGRHSPALTRQRTRQRALSRALATLARPQTHPEERDEFKVLEACRGYLADVLAIDSAALNPADMRPHLESLGSREAAEALGALVEAAFNATFTPANHADNSTAATEMSHRAAVLLQQIDSERRRS